MPKFYVFADPDNKMIVDADCEIDAMLIASTEFKEEVIEGAFLVVSQRGFPQLPLDAQVWDIEEVFDWIDDYDNEEWWED